MRLVCSARTLLFLVVVTLVNLVVPMTAGYAVSPTGTAIDVKVNGQDGPLFLTKDSKITISWNGKGSRSCTGNWTKRTIKTRGKQTGKLSASQIVDLTCMTQ